MAYFSEAMEEKLRKQSNELFEKRKREEELREAKRESFLVGLCLGTIIASTIIASTIVALLFKYCI